MMMALAMLPLLLAGGTAVDLASISARQAQLQQAMDSAALAIAREGESLSDAEANKIAKQFLDTNFDPRFADMEIKRSGTKVDIKAAARANLTFGSLLGYENWKVSAKSSADLAYTNYEIALVLDTTGSMAGGKLIAMKDAVLGLVNTMSAQVKGKDKLKFAVVPFANFVNVGPQYGPEFKKNGKIKNKTGAKWLDLKGEADFPQVELQQGLSRFELFNHLGEDWAGCVETRYGGGKVAHDVEDSAPNEKDAASLFVPAFSIDEPDEDGYSNSYIGSDADPLDNTPKGKIKKLLKYGVTTLLPIDPTLEWLAPDAKMSGGRGPNRDCVTQPIMALNTDFKAIVNKVKSLKANGNTNIMEGVAWGMRVLSPREPFTEGRDPKEIGVEKIMIVLTDGSNVFGNTKNALGSRYASQGYLVDGRLGITAGSSSDTNKLMNEKTLAACENAKAQNILVYTIRLEEPDVKTGMMLKDCASSSAHFFDAPSRSQLDEVFDEIRDRVVRLRLAS
ncbi:hypothetical protein GN330_07270 [Nitratireductor sp. CAU 1489]|uniref:VWFA domain-containing protein n=2 Tax=Nitratireductor arenosus TaxID=2682096 RepID=A0A844QDH2_9HYPH|nr:hypothetical protein [Nitratireductor arenosus]